MKHTTVTLVAISILLGVALFLTKRSDNARIETEATTITDFSNRLDAAQVQLTARNGDRINLSNKFVAAALECSNRLTTAQAALALQTEQVTNLNQQLTATAMENQTLDRHVMDLTNQLATLTQRLDLTEASLTQTNDLLAQAGKDYVLLENRFHRDVAQRVMAERRFNNLAEVQAQEQKLMKVGAQWVTPQSIYADLNVEVSSNGVVHVIAQE
jgi:chromosome segregation ATPase